MRHSASAGIEVLRLVKDESISLRHIDLEGFLQFHPLFHV